MYMYMHEIHGRVHPNWCHVTGLLVVDLRSSLAYSVMTHPLPLAGKLPTFVQKLRLLSNYQQTTTHTYAHTHTHTHSHAHTLTYTHVLTDVTTGQPGTWVTPSQWRRTTIPSTHGYTLGYVIIVSVSSTKHRSTLYAAMYIICTRMTFRVSL